jgi:hypothetical protein
MNLLLQQIDDSYSKRHLWINYYNLLNELFVDSRLKLVHDAKTISVGMVCIEMNLTYGFSYLKIYDGVVDVFHRKQSTRQLSELVNLASAKEFELSLKEIQKRFLTSIVDEDQSNLCGVLKDKSENQLSLPFQSSYASI